MSLLGFEGKQVTINKVYNDLGQDKVILRITLDVYSENELSNLSKSQRGKIQPLRCQLHLLFLQRFLHAGSAK